MSPPPYEQTVGDERPHRPGARHDWTELWHFEFGDAATRLGGFVRYAVQPRLRRTQFWAAVVRADGPYVLCRDAELELPPTPHVLEIRGGALWTHAICETPFDHWTVAMEAYALAFDDPYEAWRAELGDRVGLAFDLEWEQAGAVAPLQLDEAGGYELPCVVHGDLQIGDNRWPIAATGHRAHTWGAMPLPLPTGTGRGISSVGGPASLFAPMLVETPDGPTRLLRTLRQNSLAWREQKG